MMTYQRAEDDYIESKADFVTVPVEIENGALVEVIVWVDDNKDPDWSESSVMYKGVQVNDLVSDQSFKTIKEEVLDYLGSGWV